MSNSLISVIVPVYKTEKYLDRCVGSIREQNYPNVEIILVDDGSPDNCPEMCDSYAAADSRIKVIHKTNGGLSSARNAGLDVAKGEYIAFVDSDDTVTPDMLDEMCHVISEEGADIAVGGYYGIGIKGRIRWSLVPGGVTVYNTGKDFILQNRNSDRIPFDSAYAKLYKRELFTDIRFPVNQIYEDNWLLPVLYLNSKKVVTLPKGIYLYYEHENSIIHSGISTEKIENRLKLYIHLATFYSDNCFKQASYDSMCRFMDHYNAFRHDLPNEKKLLYSKYFNNYYLRCLFNPRAGSLRRKAGILYRRIFKI